MKVYLFDLLPYDRQFDEFKAERFMPWPLPGSHFDPQIAAHLCRASGGVGEDGSAGLRRRRPQRAPHHARVCLETNTAADHMNGANHRPDRSGRLRAA
jgi:hypothetical protein